MLSGSSISKIYPIKSVGIVIDRSKGYFSDRDHKISFRSGCGKEFKIARNPYYFSGSSKVN